MVVIFDGLGNFYGGWELFVEYCGRCYWFFKVGGDIGFDLMSY